MTAVTVAERGPGSKSDSSPNIWPGPMIASRFSRPSVAERPSFTFPSMHDVELVARVALVEQHVTATQLVSAIESRSAVAASSSSELNSGACRSTSLST